MRRSSRRTRTAVRGWSTCCSTAVRSRPWRASGIPGVKVVVPDRTCGPESRFTATVGAGAGAARRQRFHPRHHHHRLAGADPRHAHSKAGSIVIAYALERASREAVRRSYLALWDMDAPILGLVTEGPHLAGTARAATADRARPAGTGAEDARSTAADRRRLGELRLRRCAQPLADDRRSGSRDPADQRVDAAAAALWRRKVGLRRS
jgi:hypothetical protein